MDFIVLKPYVYLVRGAYRTALYDVHNQIIHVLPNSVEDVLEELKTNSITELKNRHVDQSEIVNQYVEYLLKNNLVNRKKTKAVRNTFNFVSHQTNFYQETRVKLFFFHIGNTLNEKSIQLINTLKLKNSSNVVVLIGSTLYKKNIKNLCRWFKLNGYSHVSFQPDGEQLFQNFDLIGVDSLRVDNDTEHLSRYTKLALDLNVPIFFASENTPITTPNDLFCSNDNVIRLPELSFYSNQLFLAQNNVLTYNPVSMVNKLNVVPLNKFDIHTIDNFLLGSKKFKKNNSSKCSKCEYRLACNHPIAMSKEDATELAPVYCTFDLETGVFKNNVGYTSSFEASREFLTVYSDTTFDKNYPEKLSNLIDRIAIFLKIDATKVKIKYDFFQNANSRVANANLERLNSSLQINILSSYGFDSHEITHALLASINEEPIFIVSEGAANMFENSNSAYLDLSSSKIGTMLKLLDNSPNILPISQYWELASHKQVFFGILEFLGGFFFSLIVEHGAERFIQFYESEQSLCDFKAIYGFEIDHVVNNLISKDFS